MFTLTKHCSFALMHCSCPMNSARGAGQKKKKKNENANAAMKRVSKRVLTFKSCINLNQSSFNLNHNLMRLIKEE